MPPPSRAASEIVWCGDRNGRFTISACFECSVPAMLWMRVVSSASSRVIRGMIVGTSLGVMGLGVRVFAGRQKEHLGIREEKVSEQ